MLRESRAQPRTGRWLRKSSRGGWAGRPTRSCRSACQAGAQACTWGSLRSSTRPVARRPSAPLDLSPRFVALAILDRIASRLTDGRRVAWLRSPPKGGGGKVHCELVSSGDCTPTAPSLRVCPALLLSVRTCSASRRELDAARAVQGVHPAWAARQPRLPHNLRGAGVPRPEGPGEAPHVLREGVLLSRFFALFVSANLKGHCAGRRKRPAFG